MAEKLHKSINGQWSLIVTENLEKASSNPHQEHKIATLSDGAHVYHHPIAASKHMAAYTVKHPKEEHHNVMLYDHKTKDVQHGPETSPQPHPDHDIEHGGNDKPTPKNQTRLNEASKVIQTHAGKL